MKVSIALGTLVLALFNPAWAINKCVGPNGRPVFQDRPCAGAGEKLVVKPASGLAPDELPAVELPARKEEVQPPTKQTEAQRLESQIAKSQKHRRRQDLENALVPEARAAIERNRVMCDAELASLRSKKYRANSNLAGAVWEQSISTEMAAVAARCDTRQQQLADHLEALRKECGTLSGCDAGQ